MPHQPDIVHIVYLTIKGRQGLAVVKSNLVTRSKHTEGTFEIHGQREALTRISFIGHDRVIRGIARDFWLLQATPKQVAHLREGSDFEWVHPKRGKTMLDRYVDRESKELFVHAQDAVFRALNRPISLVA